MPLPLADEDPELLITESWEGILCIFPYRMAMIPYYSLSTSCTLSAHSRVVNVALTLFHGFISHLHFCFILWKKILQRKWTVSKPSFIYVWLSNESDIKGRKRVYVIKNIDLKQLEGLRLILVLEVKRKINDSNLVQTIPEHLY